MVNKLNIALSAGLVFIFASFFLPKPEQKNEKTEKTDKSLKKGDVFTDPETGEELKIIKKGSVGRKKKSTEK